MADWGMRVSKPGFDVKTCADYELVMSSSLNLLKTSSVGTTSGTIAHGFYYTPIFMSCQTNGVGTTGLMGQFFNPGLVSIDSNNIYVSGVMRYYIFYQEGT
jgi:hypothetical protein